MAFNMDGYVDVAERIRIFKQLHPQGSLQPADLSEPFRIVQLEDKTFVVYVAAAYRTPDDPRPGIGMAMEAFPGKTNYTRDSELMNAETSAWGRAIVAALAADTQKIASLQEVRNRQQADHPASQTSATPPPATVRQQATITPFPTLKEEAPKSRTREEMIADANAKSELILEANQEAKATGMKPSNPLSNLISEKQIKLLCKLMRDTGVTDFVGVCSLKLNRSIQELSEITKREATALIGELMNGGSK